MRLVYLFENESKHHHGRKFMMSAPQHISFESPYGQHHSDPKHRHMIAAKYDQDEKAIGKITFDDDPSKDHVDVADVFVDPEHRRKGAGTSLHRAAMKHALSKNKSFFSGSVVSGANKAFWQKLETLGLATVIEKPGPDEWYYGQRLARNMEDEPRTNHKIFIFRR